MASGRQGHHRTAQAERRIVSIGDDRLCQGIRPGAALADDVMIWLLLALFCAVAGGLSLRSSRTYRDGPTPRPPTPPLTLFWPYVLLPLAPVLAVLGIVDLLS